MGLPFSNLQGHFQEDFIKQRESSETLIEMLESAGISLDGLLRRCTFDPVASPALEVAVSGGQDSMALALLALMAGHLVIAHHVDHGSRGGSDTELEKVRETLRPFAVEVIGHSASVAQGSNYEARARDARRALLGPKTSTGHTADDQAETVIINLMRGSGSKGLSGMKPGLHHPILGLRRTETMDICRALGVEPIVDPTNLDLSIQRNRVRLELLPLMSEMSRRDLVPLMCKMADLLRSEDSYMGEVSSRLQGQTLEALGMAPKVILGRYMRQIIKDRTGVSIPSIQVEAVSEVVINKAGSVNLIGGLRLRARRAKVELLSPEGEVLVTFA